MKDMRVEFLLAVLSLATISTPSFASYPISKPNCADKCGNISIPYPFGTQDGCYLDGFDLTCNETYNPPRPFLGTSNIEMIDISLLTGEARVYKYIAWRNFSQEDIWTDHGGKISFSNSYYLSARRNRFTVLGCHTYAYIFGQSDYSYASGCMSFCDGTDNIVNGTCDGRGCCQTSIPQGLQNYKVALGFNTNSLWESMPNYYAVLVEEEWYKFNTADLLGDEFLNKNNGGRARIVIDWAIRNGSCPDACLSENSFCSNAPNGPGYLCNCSQGYEGNPYLIGGCQDIDECEDGEHYPCRGTCNNIPGNYECTCPKGMQGDGKAGNCTTIPDKFPLPAKLAVGISAGVVIVLAICFIILTTLQKKKYEREKEANFNKNGGDQLLRKLISEKVETIQVLTIKELERATNNFDKDQIIGCGGRGMVYRGVMDNETEVAIKKSKVLDEQQKEEFINEIVVLSQINHRNIVRLLGCCLEVDIPMLVYEFIPNGTLFDFLHGKNHESPISLDIRLQIAIESAQALAFLHSSVNRTILHGDVKSLNILLTDNLSAKVSDFGASSLVPLDKDQFVEFVQGTAGYLDPESFYIGQLTDKSDVYSFGVVLLELITRKRAIYVDDSNENKSLATSSITLMNENKLRDLLDNEIVNETTIGVLQDVAVLALRCLSFKGEERPTMTEVAETLQAITRTDQHPWRRQNPEETETERLLGKISPYDRSDSNAFQTTETTYALHIDVGGR